MRCVCACVFVCNLSATPSMNTIVSVKVLIKDAPSNSSTGVAAPQVFEIEPLVIV